MGAGLDDPAVLHHEDAVRRPRLREPVGHHERRAVGERRAGRVLERPRARAAGLGGRLVEDGDARIAQDEPCEGELLRLGRVEGMPADPDHGLQPVGQPVDPGRTDAGERGVQPPVVGARRGEPEIVRERSGEDVDLLRHERGGRSRMLLADPHAAARRLEHARDDPRERRLPGAARPDDRDVLAGRDVEVHVVEHRVARDVAVADPRDGDRRARPRGQVVRDR